MGGIVDTITGKAGKDAKRAAAAQADLLAKKEEEVNVQEAERQKRSLKARQGRRSLLYSEGGEKGVSTTIGGGQ